MGDNMFKKMDYVYMIYKEKSFTKAAEKLYISQPCLSAAIKKLEDEIGQPLFERRYSSVKPTKIGVEYIQATEKMIEIQQDFEAKLKDLNSLEFGKINIGGTNYVTSYILPRIISEFSRLYPKIEINLIEAKSVELNKMLDNEDLDLLIDSFDEASSTQECFPLLEEKIMIAVPKSFKCNRGLENYRMTTDDISYRLRSPVSIKHFRDEKFILLKSGNNMYKQANNIFHQAGIMPDISFKLDQLSTSYSLATSECGICFVTDTVFKYHKYTDDIFIYNLKENAKRMLYVAKKKNRFCSHAMNKFIDLSKECIK